MTKVLVVDDDKNLRQVLTHELSDDGFQVENAENGKRALDLLEEDEYDVVLLDLNLPGLKGIEILKKIKDSEFPIEVVIMTAHGTVHTAVEAMKLGAYDYLTKPFRMEELRAVIEKAYEKKGLIHENLVLKTQIRRQAETERFITKSPAVLEILENVKKVALSGLPVLVSGESGVGKELIAKAIHTESKRAEGPFVPINCGAIPENMLESELFGYEKGAFTGAHARKLGLLEVADHGSLFLDEIGELNPQLQVKLLRVIETGNYFRVGGTKDIRVDVRFISATNKNIETEIEKGAFRSDLFYRIATLTVSLPPLRERREDIPLLIEHVIGMTPGHRGRGFSREAVDILTRYPWPGNVRELQNVIHRTLLLSRRNIVEPQDLPADLRKENGKDDSRPVSAGRLEDIEKEHILSVLRGAGGHKGRAAEILGVDPKTLYRKLLGYGIKE